MFYGFGEIFGAKTQLTNCTVNKKCWSWLKMKQACVGQKKSEVEQKV